MKFKFHRFYTFLLCIFKLKLLILLFFIKLSVTTAEILKSVKLSNTESLIKQQLIFVFSCYSVVQTRKKTPKIAELEDKCLQSDTRM